ncbi:MAG: ABC transporter substrate-binding protein [Saprospiraceae bacterium]
MKYLIAVVVAISTLVTFSSCEQEKTPDIVLWQATDPVKLNPMTATDAGSRRIIERIFQSLLQVDYFTYELVPVLVKSRPVIEEINDSTVAMNFEIRDEAIWDDTGEPITGEDVDFTLRLMKSPGAAKSSIRLYFDYIKEIQIDETNKKKFTIICEPYMIMESTLTNMMIMPKHIYDPENILADFTVKELTQNSKALAENSELKRYAQFFNKLDFQKNIVVGSGPYTLASWEDKQKVTLKLKENWWGNNMEKGNSWLKATPKKLIFKTIPDMNTAVTALEVEELDVMSRIPPRRFVEELRKDSSFINTFHNGTPLQFTYSYIGMKTDNDKLGDVQTRKALRHLMDAKEYSDRVFFGLSERVSTFIHPSKKKFINENLILPDYNVEKAQQLLTKAGWSDSNQDGILDKMINGERTDFKIEVLYPNVAKTSEEGVLLFKNTCEEAGIKIIPVALDFNVFLKKLGARDFEMYFGLWAAAVVESDPSQVWHTNSIGNGHNYTGFGNPESDKILEDLQKELDEDKRAILYKKLQQIIDDEAPYIFLTATRNRVAVHKRIIDPNFSSMGDGYWSSGFKLEVNQ